MQKLSKQNYLEKAKQYAISKGGVCLSDEYVNAKYKLNWKCSKGHTWESDYDHAVNRNRWCQQCFYEKATMDDGYEQAMSYAKSKGGLVLVPKNKGINGNTILTWKCAEILHQKWEASFRNTVKRGSWCPYCAGRFSKEEYLQKAKDYAIDKGGLCLSDKYENQNTELIFKCGVQSHKEFIYKYDRLAPFNKWCKECKPNSLEEKTKRAKFLEKAKLHAKTKGGQCLSKGYKNNNNKLSWQCSNMHKPWKATYQNVVGTLNRWCPECAGQFPPDEQLERAKKYAESKGGQCLSTEYITTNPTLIWKCREKSHPNWSATLSNVLKPKNSTWCPECGNSTYYKENNTRVILEFLLGFELKKSKLNWNINPKTNHRLELDGYNEKNKFAFEFQGRHHFEENVYKKSTLEDVQFRDEIKRKNCKQNGIKLLLVNDKKHMGALKDHIKYIVEILNTQKIKYNINFNLQELILKIQQFNKISPKDEYLKKAHEYAVSRGGQCLSNAYISYHEKLIWKCKEKSHSIWESQFGIVNSRSWCPYCAGKFSKDDWLEKCKNYAISKGGSCLSDEYKNNSTKLRWQCKNNHEWQQSSSSLVGEKRWCQLCNK